MIVWNDKLNRGSELMYVLLCIYAICDHDGSLRVFSCVYFFADYSFSDIELATLLFSLNALPYFINSNGASVRTKPMEATTVEAGA